jgi:hypothetical protein
MWEVLMFLSFLASGICLLILAYRFLKKKKKRPFFLGFVISFVIFFAAGMAYNANLTPEQKLANQQKTEQKKLTEAEKQAADDIKNNENNATIDRTSAIAKPSIESKIETICKDQLGSKFIEVEIRDNAGQPGTKMVVPKFKGNEGWDNDGTRKAMIIQTRDLFNKLFNSDLPISKCVAMIKFPMVDKYGNESNDNVMKCTLTDTTAAKINWKNVNQIDFKPVLDDVWIHPSLRKNN